MSYGSPKPSGSVSESMSSSSYWSSYPSSQGPSSDSLPSWFSSSPSDSYWPPSVDSGSTPSGGSGGDPSLPPDSCGGDDPSLPPSGGSCGDPSLPPDSCGDGSPGSGSIEECPRPSVDYWLKPSENGAQVTDDDGTWWGTRTGVGTSGPCAGEFLVDEFCPERWELSFHVSYFTGIIADTLTVTFYDADGNEIGSASQVETGSPVLDVALPAGTRKVFFEVTEGPSTADSSWQLLDGNAYITITEIIA